MTKLKVLLIPVTPFQQNCSLVFDDVRKVGAVVDPGGDVPVILGAIAESGITIEKILLTHGHIDHAGGAAELKEKLDVPIEGRTARIFSCSKTCRSPAPSTAWMMPAWWSRTAGLSRAIR